MNHGKIRKVVVSAALVSCTALIVASPAEAQKRPIQLSLVTPIQVFPEEDTVAGVRLNLIYGRNVSVRGLDIGLGNHTTAGAFMGVQLGLVGIADSTFMGWQNNWVNVTGGRFEGFQSGLVNRSGRGAGFQYGLVNHSGQFKGFQAGLVNYAENFGGFQLGLVNYARRLSGLQVGLVNIIREGGASPFFPIVNWAF